MIKIQKTNPTAKMLKDYTEAGQINFDLPMQRGYVWSREKKSKLILSILEGYPIPPLYANFKNRIYHVVDGKQRGKTVVEFQKNKFSLGSMPSIIIEGKEYEISGKKFNELPEDLQLIIEQFNMDIHYGDNMTDEEQKEMFIRLNSGKPLSTTEMTKAQIKSIEEVVSLSKHSVFKRIINEKGMEASRNSSLVMQVYVALFEPYKCLRASAIKKSLGETQISIEKQECIKDRLDTFEKVYIKICEEKSDIAHKLALVLKRKSHFVAFVYTIDQAIKVNVSDVDVLVLWTKNFFGSEVDKTTISDEYNAHLKNAMNDDESVRARFDAMYRNFTQFTEDANASKCSQ